MNGRMGAVRGVFGRSAVAWLLGLASSCMQSATLALDAECRAVVDLNGRALPMTIDTGCNAILLDERTVAECGLVSAGAAPTVRDATGLSRPGDALVSFDFLRFGTCTAHGEAATLDLPERAGAGLVGMVVLAHCCCIFDVPTGVLHMTVGDLGEELVRRHGMRIVARVPLGADPHRPTITVRLNDRLDVSLLLDTGALRTALPATAVADLALPPHVREIDAAQAETERRLAAQGVEVPAKAPVTVWSFGVHGEPVEVPVHRVASLAFGGTTFPDLLVTAEDHGQLGRDVLAKMPWLLNGPRRELWLLARP